MSYGDGGDGSNRGNGQKMRLLAAVAIAVVGFLIYASRTQVNPVTGEKQHIALSVDQEKALGLQAAPKMAESMGGAIDPSKDRRAAAVSEVGRRLVDRSDASRSPYVGNYHFQLLNDPDTINAFALPGGQVFITLALYDKLDTEAQLAGVLGHEIGHVVSRHSAQQMAKGQLGQMLQVAVGVGASGGDDSGRNAQMVAGMVNQMTQLSFSRADETQADGFGLRYMAESGYDPYAMLDVMNILKAASKGQRQPEFLATHPMPETRLKEIREILDKTYPNGVPEELRKGRTLPH